jgi:hypothetical protein
MDMTSQEIAKKTLKYKDTTWNKPMTAEIELLDLTTIYEDSPEQEEAIYLLGIEDWFQWDCYINHFYNYGWTELADPELPDGDVTRLLIQLGWSEASYNGDVDPPESEDLLWNELSADQQETATNLCYFEEIWNQELSIPEWSSSYTASPKATSNIPSDMPSLMPSLIPTETVPPPTE